MEKQSADYCCKIMNNTYVFVCALCVYGFEISENVVRVKF